MKCLLYSHQHVRMGLKKGPKKGPMFNHVQIQDGSDNDVP